MSRFKIGCEIADGYRDKLSLGAKTIIEIGRTKVRGMVTTITPSVTNGVIQFTVIPDSIAEGIRSGLTANVHVLHGLRDDVPRIPNSNIFAYGAGRYSVFVVEGKKAIRREITLGESSFEYVEVLDGLKQGEVVILSSMDKYSDKAEVKIK